MYLCRSTWQRLAPLTQRSAAALLLRNAPVRQMSASSVPGSGGDALPYYLFLGLAVTGGGIYVYRTLSSDRARFRDRHEYIHTQLRPVIESYSDDGEKEKAIEVSEATEEVVDSATEEAAAEEVTEEEAVPTTSQEKVVVEEEATPAPTEQEPASSPEAATEQVEEENVEASPLLTSSSDNIPEELASAAEDWSELSARKPEEVVEENAPAAQESEEIAESGIVSESS